MMITRCRWEPVQQRTCRVVCCCHQKPCEPLKQRFIEPIFQAYIKKPDAKPPHCTAKKCHSCLSEYFENSLNHGHNQLFRDHNLSLTMGRPNAVVTSPNINLHDDEMAQIQDEALNKLGEERKEIRKRYALMQMNDGVFIFGGFVVDPETRERLAPKYDYFYDAKNHELMEIPPLPGNGRMGFGLAATENDEIIAVGGHNFDYETLTSVNLLDINDEKLEWKNLPDMLNGTVGPGVSVIDNRLYVIGGFDFIGPDSVCHGEALCLDLDKKAWENLPDLDPPRARPLISIIDHTDSSSLILAGGYNFDKKGKAVPYGKIEEYDSKNKKWEEVADIPDFKTNNGLATKNNRLFLMDTDIETNETRLLKEYNMSTRRWESSSDVEKGKKHAKKPSKLDNQMRINDQSSTASSIASKTSHHDREK